MTDLVPTPEHVDLATGLRDLLDRRSDSQAVRNAVEQPDGFDATLWSTLCEQIGVAALAIPEDDGGAGFTLAETYVVLEELGRSLTPTPLLASTIASAALVATGGQGSLLEQVAGGTVATVAWSGITGPLDAPVSVSWHDGSLNGSVSPVLHGDSAEILLVVAEHEGGTGLFQADLASSGLTRTRVDGLDLTLSFAHLEFDGVSAEPIALDSADIMATTHRVGTIATAALQVGCAQRGLDMTVEYSKQRQQFGRTLGSFQALKHRMADLLVQVQMSRSGAWAAVQAHINDAPEAARLAAAAGSYSSEAAVTVGAETVQLHGGIAITWEHDAHLVLKRAQALNQFFGLPHQQRASLL